jgi:8-oxo-dGTP pyrophosphatase MutT (NUDIX family)
MITAQNAGNEPKDNFAITPIQKGAERGWKVDINGTDVTKDTTSADFTNHTLGLELRFGMRPEGYDGFIIREQGGGGAATIPYMITAEGGIYVGVVEENRAALGGVTENIPRGMQSKGETHEQTAARELLEETGYVAHLGRFSLLASGLNPNSTYFDTSKSPNDGVSMYALHVQEDELDLTHDDAGNVYYQFSKDVNNNTAPDITEQIISSRFIPLEAALKSRDMFTAAAAGHLLADLLSKGEYLVPQNKSVQPSGTAN